MARFSEVPRSLGEPQEGAGRAGTGAVASAVPAAGGEVAVRPAAAATGSNPAAAVFPGGLLVPGLGTITAASRAASAARQAAGIFDEVQKTMWQAEAQRHLGRVVLISVKNSTQPLQRRLAQH